jgi:hypothetical protein
MTDRLRDAVAAVLRGMLPNLPASLRWEYRVTGVQPGPPVIISATPIGSSPFGDLANITLWPGPSGTYAAPLAGSKVLIEFHEADPRKPAVCGLDPASYPTAITMGGPAPQPLALGPISDANVAAIKTWLTTHTHPVPGVTVGSGATTSSPSALPAPVTTSTGSTVSKSQ